MSAENARPTRGTGALESAGGPSKMVPVLIRACGCDVDGHTCGLEEWPNADRLRPCSGHCMTLSGAEMVDAAKPYGGRCPCTVPASRRRTR
jgi:hypothetical protein